MCGTLVYITDAEPYQEEYKGDCKLSSKLPGVHSKQIWYTCTSDKAMQSLCLH